MKNKNAFIESILQEIELRKDELGSDKVNTIYFGGGTPTVLEIKEINRVINSVFKNFKTIENPKYFQFCTPKFNGIMQLEKQREEFILAYLNFLY